MDPIQAAIEAIESRDIGEDFTYTEVAKRFGVSRVTLARRHQKHQAPRATKIRSQQKLHPQQELELVRYIEKLTERRTPPTREMIRNFASAIAKEEVSESWITRFTNRKQIHLISSWVTGMDRNRHQADSREKYSLYFNLLHQKSYQYNLEPRDIYNMDEKGFLIGITGRSKRVFSRRMWEKKEVTEAIQDGSREWITLLACVGADGIALPPSLIFQSAAGTIQSSWAEAIKSGEHSVFITSSPSGWTNNDIGLAWLEQVFDRHTKERAGRSHRLLILDGHGSHLTMDFIEYCDRHRILLAVFPPHSTHSLQPLDVVLFKPLSSAYSKELSSHLHTSQGLLSIKKGDFFPLFWRSWVSFKEETILKSFSATGIWPPDPDVILKRFGPYTPEPSSSRESSTSILSGEDWLKIETLIRHTTKDQSSKEVKKLSQSLHHISTQNELLHHEIIGLKEALLVKKRHKKKSYTLDLQQQQEYHGGATFWSPRKVREAQHREAIKKQERDQEQLQKVERSKLREQARLYKVQVAQEKRVERERAKAIKEKEKAKKATSLIREKAARNSKKAIQLPQKGKRKASQASSQSNKRQKRVVDTTTIKEPSGGASAPPAITTRRGRNVKLPSKYK